MHTLCVFRVTHFTTEWLMGPSVVVEGSRGDRDVLLIEKCRFLEASGCVQTCVHACKMPTQAFFADEMGLSVALRPNFTGDMSYRCTMKSPHTLSSSCLCYTDYSCRFEFGISPVPLDLDATLPVRCLEGCMTRRRDGVH